MKINGKGSHMPDGNGGKSPESSAMTTAMGGSVMSSVCPRKAAPDTSSSPVSAPVSSLDNCAPDKRISKKVTICFGDRVTLPSLRQGYQGLNVDKPGTSQGTYVPYEMHRAGSQGIHLCRVGLVMSSRYKIH